MFPILRILIGIVFLVSGVEKAISPYQNFLYAIQAYAALPGWAETWVAQSFPWLEIAVGAGLILGLWTRQALVAAILFFAVFIIVVGQALFRGLDIANCGCFGQLIHLSPRITIVFDSLMLLIAFLLWRFSSTTDQFSLDRKLK